MNDNPEEGTVLIPDQSESRIDDPKSPILYCTIVAQNYLPQAHALLESVRRQQPEIPLKILVVDGVPNDLASRAGVAEYDDLAALELPASEVSALTAIYDVVELSTAVKARYLQVLLRTAERVVYLDPDMYLVSPLSELPAEIDEHQVVLTPHILHPIPPDTSFISEGSSLTVGIHNLGFCAVGRGAEDFLEWWWSHLRRECLIYPLLGLFVDQKWIDMGAVLFSAKTLRHPGYNIGHWNLHERKIVSVDGEYRMSDGVTPVRLMHFSGFQPEDPEAISVRQNENLRDKGLASPALSALSHEYASVLLAARSELGTMPEYGFGRDSSGRRMTVRLRRTIRTAIIQSETSGDDLPPSPFDQTVRDEWARWRRSSLRLQMQNAAPDAALAFKYAFPDTFKSLRRRLPALTGRLRRRMLDDAKVRR